MTGGLGTVGVCVVVSGLLVNVYLAVVARNLSPADYSYFGSFWSLALVVGFGVFLPVEQELARWLQRGGNKAAVPRAAVLAAVGMGVAELAVVLAAAPLLLTSFGQHFGMVVALAALCLVSAGQFLVRGALIGRDRMVIYGLLLVWDTMIRVGIGLMGGSESSWYAWTVVAAIALAHLPLLPSVLRGGRSQPVAPGPYLRAVGQLLIGSLSAQLLLNGLPVVVSLAASGDEKTEAGRFLAAFLLVRIPLFVAVPLQTALLPALTASPRRVLVRLAAVVALIGVAGVAVAATVGPWLVQLVFGDQYVVSRPSLTLIVLGVTVHLALIIITQALVAGGLHSAVARSWLTGIAVAAVVFLVMHALVLAAELAFLLGSGVGCVVGVLVLLTRDTKEVLRAG